jgi:hypothetical protein
MSVLCRSCRYFNRVIVVWVASDAARSVLERVMTWYPSGTSSENAFSYLALVKNALLSAVAVLE